MNRRFPIYVVLALLGSMFVASCNDDSEDEIEYDNSSESAVMVTSFSLVKNDSVLANLDSVFFSIDLNNAVIFNADSLPKGTKVSRLPVSIGLSSVSTAEITMPGKNGSDTIVNYLTNSTDSIDFSRGSVKLKLVSYNKLIDRTYTIYVNVHNMDPDSLAWGETAMCALPTSLSAPSAQKTVEFKGQAVCFTQQGANTVRAISSNPANNDWDIAVVSLPSGVVLETLTASDDALYVVGGGNVLYKSQDTGSTWTSTGAEMSYIYGGYGTSVVGVKADGNGAYKHVTYPATTETAVSGSCPVSGTSTSLLFTTKWSEQPMMMILGGRTASGDLTGDMWAYDGSQWVCMSINGIPDVEGATIVPYFSFRTATDWVVTEYTTLLAFGGKDANGICTNTVYMSLDRGVHWSKAGELMQLPDYMPQVAYAQALVFEKTIFDSSRAAGWKTFAPKALPAWYKVIHSSASRADKPITQWDCPYIYLFGGIKSDGTLSDTVWRGVINRLSFKPLQ